MLVLHLTVESTLDIVDEIKKSKESLQMHQQQKRIQKIQEIIDIVDAMKRSIPEPEASEHEPVALEHEPVASEFEKISIYAKIESGDVFPLDFVMNEKMQIDGVNIYQLRVLEQDAVIGRSWTCGFQSIKNVAYVLQALQTNPMTEPVAQKLYRNVMSREIFKQIFVGNSTLNNPEPKSWLSCAKTIKDFKPNDGIFPNDQKILIDQMKRGNCLIPPGVSPSILDRIFPVHGVTDDVLELDGYIVLGILSNLKSQKLSAVGFCIPSGQHLIGVVLHRISPPDQIEIFVVDSLNADLIFRKNILENFIKSYRNF